MPTLSPIDTGILLVPPAPLLTRVALGGSPYHPVEDPAAAVVFGGSPDRVLETIVDGETRHRRGETEWHEAHSTASVARRRMLAARSR